jgi:hypothetical protein
MNPRGPRFPENEPRPAEEQKGPILCDKMAILGPAKGGVLSRPKNGQNGPLLKGGPQKGPGLVQKWPRNGPKVGVSGFLAPRGAKTTVYERSGLNFWPFYALFWGSQTENTVFLREILNFWPKSERILRALVVEGAKKHHF